MNLGELRTELWARGFDYLTSARADAFINRAYYELCEEEDWPFLEASTSGTAPLSVSDLRTIESVIDTTAERKLVPLDRRLITDIDFDLTTTGTPTYYYTTSGSAVAVYPANTTDTISVRYWKVPGELDDDADDPLVPARFSHVIVDGAVAYAYFDSDNFEAAMQTLELWEVSKRRMRDALLVQQHDRPDDFIVNVVAHQDA